MCMNQISEGICLTRQIILLYLNHQENIHVILSSTQRLETSPETGAGKTRRRLAGTSSESEEPWGSEELASSQHRLSSHEDKPRFRKVTVFMVCRAKYRHLVNCLLLLEKHLTICVVRS